MSELVQPVRAGAAGHSDGEGKVSVLFGVDNAERPQAEATTVTCHMFRLRLLDNRACFSCFYSAQSTLMLKESNTPPFR